MPPTHQDSKSNVIAWLMLLALIGILAAHRINAADLFPLDRIGVVRSTPNGADRLAMQPDSDSVRREVFVRAQ